MRNMVGFFSHASETSGNGVRHRQGLQLLGEVVGCDERQDMRLGGVEAPVLEGFGGGVEEGDLGELGDPVGGEGPWFAQLALSGLLGSAPG